MKLKMGRWLLTLHRLATRQEERRLERGRLSIITSMISWGSESIAYALHAEMTAGVSLLRNPPTEKLTGDEDRDQNDKTGWTQRPGCEMTSVEVVDPIFSSKYQGVKSQATSRTCGVERSGYRIHRDH